MFKTRGNRFSIGRFIGRDIILAVNYLINQIQECGHIRMLLRIVIVPNNTLFINDVQVKKMISEKWMTDVGGPLFTMDFKQHLQNPCDLRFAGFNLLLY